MNDYKAIVDIETEELSIEELAERYQVLIDSGLVWKLQGTHGRTAHDLIVQGYCTLGEVGHRDYWGNYVPSKHEVKPGTKGSQEFVNNREDR